MRTAVSKEDLFPPLIYFPNHIDKQPDNPEGQFFGVFWTNLPIFVQWAPVAPLRLSHKEEMGDHTSFPMILGGKTRSKPARAVATVAQWFYE